jgi:hypothetical protein
MAALAALLLVGLGAACTPGSSAQESIRKREDRMSSTTEAQHDRGTRQFIVNTGQAQFGDDLRVGAGNIWEEEYLDEAGHSARGLTGGLWFFVRDRPELDHHVRVHPGQWIEFGGYRVRVLEVTQGGIGLSVLLPGEE